MVGLVNGIAKITAALQPIALGLLILSLVILGISTIIGGSESHVKFKEAIKWIIVGSAVAFGASAIGKEIMSWFV